MATYNAFLNADFTSDFRAVLEILGWGDAGGMLPAGQFVHSGSCGYELIGDALSLVHEDSRL